MNTGLVLKIIEFGSKEYQTEVDLRFNILRKPLGLKFSEDELNKEFSDFHIGAYVESILVGCLILSPIDKSKIKMRQVAVAANQQRLGIGKKLVAYAESLSKQKGYARIVLNARETAVPFYINLGYKIESDLFTEVKIPHRKMYKEIDPDT